MEKESRWLTDNYWLSPFNFADEVRDQFTLPKRVYFHDVTLREVLQCPHLCLRPEEKIRVARALDKLGVDSIENGAYMSQSEKEVTKELVKMQHKGEIKAKVVPLAHWYEKDIDIALETGADRVMISAVGNPWIVERDYGITPDELVEKMTKTCSYAKKQGLFVTAEIYDTYKTPIEFLERFHKSVVYEGGADRLSVSDTLGFALPWAVTYLIRRIKSWIPNTPIEYHGHNDYGIATIGMAAAVVGGAEVVHTSINAVGERAGNAATEEVAMVLELLLGVKTGINLNQIYPICELVAELTKDPIPRKKAITGDNLFVSGSGMVVWHQFKIFKTERPWSYLPFAPGVIGRTKGFEPILGVGCGKAIVADRLEKMGIAATDEQMSEIAEKVKEEAFIRKWSVPEHQFKEIVRSVIGK